MDKYERLMEIFSDALKESRDYHIAYIHGIGYASVIGLYQKGEKLNTSMQIDEIFYSPQEMAGSIAAELEMAVVLSKQKVYAR